MRTNLTRKPLQTICRWRFQCIARRYLTQDSVPDLAAELEQKLSSEIPTHIGNGASIYRVPDRLRSVEPEAYEPNIVSIGPYHHEAAHLQAMESTKWSFFHRLFHPSKPNHPNLNAVLDELKQMEPQARSCYSEDLKISSKQFIKMMLIDSSFVIQLLRETSKINKVDIKRWMLPVLQRDLIKLENQLPMLVLNKVYELTSEPTENLSLKELALQYFESMIYKDLDTPVDDASGVKGSHFLQIFRDSICPTQVAQNKFVVKEPHMFRSAKDLKESGVKIKKAENCQPLDVSFKKGVLKIAPVSMDDYRFTLFRNMVAFEQCHLGCRPHVTAYVFFIDRLINSAEDIKLLHYSGVMQHTLGGNKHAARLVNKLCIEVAGAVDDSYLRDVLWKINCYCNDGRNQKRAKLQHEYFYNIWVSIATMAAILVIYLTVLQTIWGLGDENARKHMSETGFWHSVADAFLIPLFGIKPSKNAPADGFWLSIAYALKIPFVGIKPSKNAPADGTRIFERLFGDKELDDTNPFYDMSC